MADNNDMLDTIAMQKKMRALQNRLDYDADMTDDEKSMVKQQQQFYQKQVNTVNAVATAFGGQARVEAPQQFQHVEGENDYKKTLANPQQDYEDEEKRKMGVINTMYQKRVASGGKLSPEDTDSLNDALGRAKGTPLQEWNQ